MKSFIKKSGAGIAAASMILTNVSSVFAASSEPNIDTQSYIKDNSYIENIRGKAKFENKTNIEISNERANSVTTKKININTQKIKGGNGEVVISNKKKTNYKNISMSVIVDLEVDINSPIVYGNEVDLTIKEESETNFDNVQADRIYKFDYVYNNPVRLSH